MPPLVCSTSGMRAPSAGEMPMKSPNGGARSMLSRSSFTVYGGSLRKIVEAANVAGLEAGATPMPLEERNLPAALHRREKARLLPCAELVARDANTSRK